MYDREYHKKYQKDNREQIREQRRQYRESNKEEIAAKKKDYYSKKENRKRKAQRSAALYQLNRDKVLARQSARRKERLDFINGVALQYGCQNQNCKWYGEWIGSQLDFHHYDPNSKLTEVSKMESWSYVKIIQEINKCVVLCKNCHALVHAGVVVLDESKICRI